MSNKFKILSNTTKKSESKDLFFTFFNGNILVKKENNNLNMPIFEDIQDLDIQFENEFFLGEFRDRSCFAIQVVSEIILKDNFELIPFNEVGALIEEEMFLIAGRASQILNWDNTHRFCGRCGTKTETKKYEIAKVCTSCSHVMYPVICPAIIVAVTKGDKILLAKNKNFRNNTYSLIAGFVEAGEDLKSTVKREVFEEVGIKIKNIRYYKSSPWAFPNSLMIGFFAEYESGEIRIDEKEIVDADWFTKDEFPNIPKKFTIARKIIDKFTNQM